MCVYIRCHLDILLDEFIFSVIRWRFLSQHYISCFIFIFFLFARVTPINALFLVSHQLLFSLFLLLFLFHFVLRLSCNYTQIWNQIRRTRVWDTSQKWKQEKKTKNFVLYWISIILIPLSLIFFLLFFLVFVVVVVVVLIVIPFVHKINSCFRVRVFGVPDIFPLTPMGILVIKLTNKWFHSLLVMKIWFLPFLSFPLPIPFIHFIHSFNLPLFYLVFNSQSARLMCQNGITQTNVHVCVCNMGSSTKSPLPLLWIYSWLWNWTNLVVVILSFEFFFHFTLHPEPKPMDIHHHVPIGNE